jgi:hypothetical protein
VEALVVALRPDLEAYITRASAAAAADAAEAAAEGEDDVAVEGFQGVKLAKLVLAGREALLDEAAKSASLMNQPSTW